MIALLLDRDGTLMEDVGYPNDSNNVRLLPGAAEAIKILHDDYDCRPAIVSNQSGVARGLITSKQMLDVHARFVDLFQEASGLKLPGFYCPHGVEVGCDCRKPKLGLLHQAVKHLNMVGQPAVMIGDKPSDVEAGMAFGAKTVWLSWGRTYPAKSPVPDFIANDWSDVLAWAATSLPRRRRC